MGTRTLHAQTPLVLIIALTLINCSLGQEQTITFNGITYKSQLKSQELRGGFYAFYGIPYARQPVGRFRFKRPEPIEHMNADEIKKSFGTPRTKSMACAQIDPFSNMTDLTTSSEDCLRVDLYILKKVFDRTNEFSPMAVLIEGFDFKQSVAHKIQPERSFLVEDSGFDILAVVHSRLGALGYLTTEDDEGPANLGLWDQHRALNFLKNSADIIKADASLITVLGFGSGGISTSIHIISGKNDFVKTAIISGGSALGPDANVRFAKERATDFGYEVGCTSSNTRKFIECLRGVKLETLLEKGANPQFIFGPVADKNHTNDNRKSYLSDWPAQLARTATFDNIRSIVYGYPENAGCLRYYSLPTGATPNSFKPSLFGVVNKTATARRTSRALLHLQEGESLTKRIGMYLAPYQGYGDTLKTVSASVQFVYFRNHSERQVLDNDTLFRDIMCLALTDYLSFAPVVSLAHLHAEAKVRQARSDEQTSTGVYIYVRKSDPEVSSFRRNMRVMSGHGWNREKMSTYMDDLLQLVGVEGTSMQASNDPDQPTRQRWVSGLRDLAIPNRLPVSFGAEYHPKSTGTTTYITEVTRSNRADVQVPYREPQRIFWSNYVPTLEDTLNVISAKSRDRHDTALTYKRSTWGVTAGLIVACLVAVVLGVLFWREKSLNSKSLTSQGGISFKSVAQNDPSVRV